MCGRYTLKATAQKLAEAFVDHANVPTDMPPRYNIAPSQPVAVIANSERHQVEFFQWGLIPSWAKDPKIGNRMINARSETLAEKPSFRTAYRRRRCLVLADGFYEWRRNSDKSKTPMYIQLEDQVPFAFAGLWEVWHSPQDDTILSCTILTTEPNDLMTTIHNRMPVILPRDAYAQWLDPNEQKPDQLQALLKPYPAEEMMAYPVSTVVNNPGHDVPECVQPVAEV
ncbi:MAG: SOS response-associated peptidase [Anaerolineaceae bacterium]|nr:SOS response-associated peptidase [Anaerolineaceae bacterium]MCB9098922.1 SOS response-associated peptidase [Anaerolineales bacterium]